MRKLTAIAIGRVVGRVTRLFKIGGGSAAPGYYALKVDPELITELISQVPKNIIITGTNGKTTTARMLAHFAKQVGLRVIRNSTGSNLERGIASTLLTKLHLKGVVTNFDLGIWEVDEAAFNTLTPKINPDIIIFLNISRDQLDRYGEVDTVIKGWKQTLTLVNPKTTIILNGDDISISSLTSKAIRFGLGNTKKVKLDLEARDLKTNGLSGTKFTVTPYENIKAKLPIPGIYNIYNFLAAFAAAQSLGIKPGQIIKSLPNYKSAFGRVEKFDFGYILLIKNPVGATEVLKTIAPILKSNDRLLIALNDNFADGTDVSWIWDTDFEQLFLSLRAKRSNPINITCSGTRALDMAIRLKYAGFDPKQITIEQDLKKAFKASQEGLKDTLYILPTYTAMLQLQRILTKSGIKKHYWEEI